MNDWVLIYQAETDGDLVIETFPDAVALSVRVRVLGLTVTDYAVVVGTVIKTFEGGRHWRARDHVQSGG